MAHILFDQGKKLGEVSEWNLALNEPVYKDVLGKNVLMPATHDVCSFITPKPVSRKTQLTIVENQKKELVLQIKSVKGMTVTAFITARNNL
ncbi:MAG: hypothetical protein H7Z71_02265 [Moraxellaceae bacterium]|nr:hypothetical protein [Pseudobdellovibrionaceae bacterium]